MLIGKDSGVNMGTLASWAYENRIKLILSTSETPTGMYPIPVYNMLDAKAVIRLGVHRGHCYLKINGKEGRMIAIDGRPLKEYRTSPYDAYNC